LRIWSVLTTFVIQVLIGGVAGGLVGYWLDKKFNTIPILTIVLGLTLFVGIAIVSFKHLRKTLKSLSQ